MAINKLEESFQKLLTLKRQRDAAESALKAADYEYKMYEQEVIKDLDAAGATALTADTFTAKVKNVHHVSVARDAEKQAELYRFLEKYQMENVAKVSLKVDVFYERQLQRLSTPYEKIADVNTASLKKVMTPLVEGGEISLLDLPEAISWFTNRAISLSEKTLK